MIKNSLINLNTKTALKKNKARRGNIPFSKVRSIGILHSFNTQEEIKTIYHFFDQLEKGKIKVEVLVVKDKNEELNVPEFTIVNKQEISQLGKWNNDSIIAFKDNSFDYLLHINLNGTDVLTENILAHSKAKCRAGKYFEDKEQFYELMVTPKDDHVKKLIDQIYHYIQLI